MEERQIASIDPICCRRIWQTPPVSDRSLPQLIGLSAEGFRSSVKFALKKATCDLSRLPAAESPTDETEPSTQVRDAVRK